MRSNRGNANLGLSTQCKGLHILEPSHTPGPVAARPSLVSPAGGKAPASARILDSLAGGVGVRVPAHKKAARTPPIWFGIGLVTAFALVTYGVVSQMPGAPAAVPVAVQASVVPPVVPPVILPPVVVTAPTPTEIIESQAATITNEPQEPAPGDPSATAAADNHNVLTNALEKDVKPPPLTLSRALESAPKASAKTAAKAPDKAAKETKVVKAASALKASPAKPDRDVEILQVLVAHNAKRRAALNPAPAGDVKSLPPQSRASAPPASSEPAPPENPE